MEHPQGSSNLEPAPEFTLDSSLVHTRWDSAIEALITVASGDIVTVDCRDGFDGQVSAELNGADLDLRLHEVIDSHRVAPLTGPIAVRGAALGDTVEVRILDLVPHGVGNIVIFPSWSENDFLLPSERETFPHGWIRTFDMDNAVHRGFVQLTDSIRVPLAPMLGMVGTAPAAGNFATGPPRDFGGNMDIKDAQAGASVFLPVFQPGALVSVGDGHAVQADGEICATAIETPIRARIQLILHKGLSLSAPRVESADEIMFVGHGRSLAEAGRQAIRFALDYLVTSQGMDSYEAYALLSLAGNLRVNQVVNAPQLGMRLCLPKSLLTSLI